MGRVAAVRVIRVIDQQRGRLALRGIHRVQVDHALRVRVRRDRVDRAVQQRPRIRRAAARRRQRPADEALRAVVIARQKRDRAAVEVGIAVRRRVRAVVLHRVVDVRVDPLGVDVDRAGAVDDVIGDLRAARAEEELRPLVKARRRIPAREGLVPIVRDRGRRQDRAVDLILQLQIRRHTVVEVDHDVVGHRHPLGVERQILSRHHGVIRRRVDQVVSPCSVPVPADEAMLDVVDHRRLVLFIARGYVAGQRRVPHDILVDLICRVVWQAYPGQVIALTKIPDTSPAVGSCLFGVLLRILARCHGCIMIIYCVCLLNVLPMVRYPFLICIHSKPRVWILVFKPLSNKLIYSRFRSRFQCLSVRNP